MSDKNARVSKADLRFARSATKHRVPKESIRHVIGHYAVRFEEPPPVGGPASNSTRIVYLGEDVHGQTLEIMAVEGDSGDLLVIHAMQLRAKYRQRLEELKND
jgi:hypothetical protein